MEQGYYKSILELSQLGIKLAFVTRPGGYNPLHWHEELEILYPLNGEADIIVEDKKYRLPKKNLTVIESGQVHSTHTYDKTAMFLRVHVSKSYLQSYLPDVELYKIECIPELISDELFSEYFKICELLAEITRLYISDESFFRMEAEGLVLQVLARLFRHFSTNKTPQMTDTTVMSIDRIRTIISYVEEHYMENISLDDVSELIGVGKEYFCRFFKKNMGMSFLQYLTEVRLSHVYHGLQETDLPVAELMEENGFSNQKLFNREFKALYGCTPSAVRKMNKSSQ
ncbi:MAG: AraC family transcriptional regulator [Ruminococcus sp.]|nr:AraC family transcriptional regulator [Ruminococcus sp.]